MHGSRLLAGDEFDRMQAMSETCDARGDGSEVILLARWLDRGGRPLDLAAIRSIRCSIYRLASRGRALRRRIAGFNDTALNVHDVLLDALQKDSMWAIDDIGYNFRHAVRIGGRSSVLSKPGQSYDVEYLVTQKSGETTIVRFRLRGE